MNLVEAGRKNVLLNVYIDTNMDKDFSILSKSKDAFIIIDVQGKIGYVSQAGENFLGYPSERLQKMGLHDLFLPTFLNQQKLFFKGRVQEKLDNFDSQVLLNDERIADVNIMSLPIFFEEDFLGSYLILKDITEIKRKRQLTVEREKQYNCIINKLSRLSEKQAAAGQLAAGIAHEIRNPITAIKGFLQLLMGENNANQVYLEIINSEIDRIEMILKELMVLAKPSKQKFERVKIQQLLDQVLTLMASQALLNNIKIEKHYHFKNTTILGDKNQLKQVFINYIKNGMEAMPESGKLRLEGEVVSGNHVQIRIIDQGPGIPQDIIEQVGEPFFTTKENGTGLGMLVSQQIISDHKGDIKIKSDANGTSINVNIPVMQ